MSDEKLNIEDVFRAFQEYAFDVNSAMQEWRNTLLAQKLINEAQEKCKKALGPLADYIDWSNKNG